MVPSLTTVAVPMYELGRTAVEMLATVLNGRRAASAILPCELRVRESTSGAQSTVQEGRG
jgi:LacI family transcriptional regulator